MKKAVVMLALLSVVSSVSIVMAQGTSTRFPEAAVRLHVTGPPEIIPVENASQEILDTFATAGISPEEGEISIFHSPDTERDSLEDISQANYTTWASLFAEVCIICFRGLCLFCIGFN